jgi:hypothetical protein
MKKSFPETLLNQPIADLEVSDTFKDLCRKYGYQTPGDILNLPRPQDLLKQEGFTVNLLLEFTQILSANGLRHYLMPL